MTDEAARSKETTKNCNTQRSALDHEMDSKYVPRLRAGLRARKRPNYDKETCKIMIIAANHRAHLLEQMDAKVIAPAFDVHHLADASQLAPVYAVLLTQYCIKRGLPEFGQQGDDAVSAEMLHLHELEVMTPKFAPALREKE